MRFEVTPQGVVCTLEICGVTKADVGDYPVDLGDRPNENRATTSAAQAFKRAYAQFGLGRYLYSLPHMWADYDADQKAFVAPQGVVMALYQAAGLQEYISDASDQQAQEVSTSRTNGTRSTSNSTRSTPANASEPAEKLPAPAPPSPPPRPTSPTSGGPPLRRRPHNAPATARPPPVTTHSHS